ncbi:MAG TPA: c-type cytochrome [Terriglobia bacterium]|nr:c-type cytochrome [Terriglobia bacterium]
MTARFAMGRLWFVVLVWSACGLAAGTCLAGKKGVRGQTGTSSVLQGAPGAASRLQNPYAGSPNAVLAGRKLFLRHCASCHGESADGGRNAPPLRSGRVRETPVGVLFWFLKKGNLRAGMPSWSGLPPGQRWQIVSFLKSLR